MKPIKQEHYTYQGRPVLLSTVETYPGRYETALLSDDCAEEYKILESWSEAAALSDYAHLRRTYRPDAEILQLSGKYACLRDDLRAAAETARQAAAQVHDGGTCNLDAPSIYLPRWKASLVEEAARQAGCGCFRWHCAGSWVFPLRNISGQAYRRETAAEAATAYLSAQGYDALTYCQID